MESTPGADRPQEQHLPTVELAPLPGSHRPPAPGFAPAAAAPLAPQTPVEATLVLRRRAEPDAAAFSGSMDPDQLGQQFGASPTDLDLVVKTMTDLGAGVVEADAPSRRVKVSGSAALLGHIFGTQLQEVAGSGEGGSRRRTGGLSVPANLDGVVTAVLGLDDRPQSRTRLRIAPAAATSTSYTPLELGEIYDFPSTADGTGTRIAIIELGGGFDQAELDEYFGALGIERAPVVAVGVDGAQNQPGSDPDGADGEVLLDIEVAGALAPGADVVVYFAPNTDAGFLDAVSQAAHDSPTPAAMSISWGQSEDEWTPQARTAMDQAFADAALLGISVSAAAGDDGSTDRASDDQAHVDFPASSPHILACGGTRLEAKGATVVAETVWNNGKGAGATGGGISRAFPLPSWQQDVGVPALEGTAGRGVPDVAAVADPQTGYRVRVDGRDMVIGGTSAVAPLWAALVARFAQLNGSGLGLLSPRIYAGLARGRVQDGFRDILSGDNGAYRAGPGWDPCTGLGVPDGAALAAFLTAGSAGTA